MRITLILLLISTTTLSAQLIGEQGPEETFFNGQTWVTSWEQPIENGIHNWIPQRKYQLGDKAVHRKELYRVKIPHTSSNKFSPINWCVMPSLIFHPLNYWSTYGITTNGSS